LLTLTRVDVNKPMDGGFTPFHITCLNGHKEVVSLLLADMRIDVNKPENDQCTPVWIASQSGYLPAVQLILASGREVNTTIKSFLHLVSPPSSFLHLVSSSSSSSFSFFCLYEWSQTPRYCDWRVHQSPDCDGYDFFHGFYSAISCAVTVLLLTSLMIRV